MPKLKFPKPIKGIKKRTPISRVRKTPLSKLKKELMYLVKEFVKKRDNYNCQHCHKRVEGSNCHASHVIPVSAGKRLAYDPTNIKVLCYHCHINWWHKHPTESGKWFRETFPDRMKYLDERKNEIIHWREIDYRLQIEQFSK